jgi:hypothetical protein
MVLHGSNLRQLERARLLRWPVVAFGRAPVGGRVFGRNVARAVSVAVGEEGEIVAVIHRLMRRTVSAAPIPDVPDLDAKFSGHLFGCLVAVTPMVNRPAFEFLRVTGTGLTPRVFRFKRFEWMTGLVLSSQPGFAGGFGWEAILGLRGLGAGCIGFRCFR